MQFKISNRLCAENPGIDCLPLDIPEKRLWYTFLVYAVADAQGRTKNPAEVASAKLYLFGEDTGFVELLEYLTPCAEAAAAKIRASVLRGDWTGFKMLVHTRRSSKGFGKNNR